MIEKKINNLKSSLNNMRMSADDKHEVFKRISLVVDKIEAVSTESHIAPVTSPFLYKSPFGQKFASNVFVYIRQRKFVPSLVIVLLLCVTGGFSAAAENSLPGDFLYSLKLNVNEQVKGIVAVTPEAKARLAIETTERRLQEAIILSSQGKLTDANKQIIQGQLSKSAADVKDSVATLVAANNIAVAQEVSINFEASLKTHELILETITDASSTLAANTNATSTASSSSAQATVASAYPANTLLQDIRQEISYNTQVRQNLSLKEIAQDNDPVKIAQKIKDAKTKFADLDYQRNTLSDLSPASIKLLNSYLDNASTSISSAEEALKAGDSIKSISILQKAVKSMSDSDSLISIELNSKPETRKALDLIDINKLINANADNDASSVSTSTSATSTGAVLGTSTESIITSSSTTSIGKTEVK